MNNIKSQLFILPFAGGAKASFREFETYINSDIEVITIEYPGRGSRISEPFCDSMDELIVDAKMQIIKYRRQGIPFALMGYSMGCEVAFDLAQYALEEKPVYLIFCARESIEYTTVGHDYALLDKEQFIDRVVALGGIDERIQKDKRFLMAAVKPIYADYLLLNQYEYHAERGSLIQDILVFYSNNDTPQSKVEGWSKHTSGEAEFYELGNNHFFINQFCKEMATIIAEHLRLKTV